MGEQKDTRFDFAEWESILESIAEPKPEKQHYLKDSPSMKCDVHKDHDVEFFCKIHDEIVCEMCRNISHRTCSPVEKIKDVSVGISSSSEYLELEKKLTTLEQDNRKNMEITADRTAEMDAVYENAMKEIETVFKRRYEYDRENLEAISSTSKSIAAEIHQLKEGLKSADEVEVFMMMKKANIEVHKFQKSLKMVRKDAKVSHYGLVPIESNGRPSNTLAKVCTFPMELRKFTIETQSDRHHCSVSGLVLLNNGRLVVADNGNKKIKLFNIKTKTLTSELPLDTTPLALTRIGDELLIMSSATERKAFTFSVTDKVQPMHHFEIDGMCQNICCNGTKLAVSFSDRPETQILGQHGNVIKTIYTQTGNGVETSKNSPKTVTFSRDPYNSDRLYQADCTENKLIQMNSDGDIIVQFEDPHMKYPVGFAHGADGNIYICCRDSDNIFKLSHDLVVGHEILTEKNGLVSPWCIAFCNDENLLYVGGYGSKDIQVFKI